jgi:putative salt-induced outer membrane protein
MIHPVCAEETPPDPQWKHQVELGTNGSSGNTDSSQIHAGYLVDYADDYDKWKFVSAYDRAKSDDKLSRNRFFADLKKEWLWPESPWFGFLQGRYDKDRFQDWDYRFSASGGIGYKLYKDDTWDVANRVGVGGFTTRGVEDDVSTPELILALDVDWAINDIESLDFSTAFYPDLDENGEYRNLTSINWRIKMVEESNLVLKLGLVNEYESLVEEGTEKNDFTYNFSLAWRF